MYGGGKPPNIHDLNNYQGRREKNHISFALIPSEGANAIELIISARIQTW
jgi:hypothetical protein